MKSRPPASGEEKPRQHQGLGRPGREQRYGEYSTLVATYEAEFGSQPYYHTFRAIMAQMKGDVGGSREADHGASPRRSWFTPEE